MEEKAKPEKELFDFQKSLLSDEIALLHSQISHFDALSFQIKGWAITVWSALIAFGAKEHNPAVTFASFPAILSFWILDGLFKQYQRRNRYRKALIEDFFASEGEFRGRGLREAV